MSDRLWRILRIASVLAFSVFSCIAAVRAVGRWREREVPAVYGFLETLDRTIPKEAAIVLVMSPEEGRQRDACILAAKLHPRPVYTLPAGASTLEEAGSWIRLKKVDWAISLGGGRYFNAEQAWVRRIDGGR